eukprot:gene9328-12570_t
MTDINSLLSRTSAFTSQMNNTMNAAGGTLQQPITSQQSLHVNKKMRINDIPVIVAIHKQLTAIKDGSHSFNTLTDNLEIEVRIGMMIDGNKRWKGRTHHDAALIVGSDDRRTTSLSFKSGVDSVFAKQLRAKLSNNNYFTMTENPIQILRNDHQNNRWEVEMNSDETNSSIIMMENKQKITRSDIALLAFDYDIRIDSAIETNMNNNNNNNYVINTSQWIQERRKHRKTYIAKPESGILKFHKNNPVIQSCWKIDFTEVEVIKNDNNLNSNNINNNSIKQTEIELELLDDMKLKWLNEKDENLSQLFVEAITSQLYSLLLFCIPTNVITSGIDPLEKCDSIGSYLHGIIELNKLISQKFKNYNNNNNYNQSFEFFGSMPVNLSRHNLTHIISNDYFLTEKSDGTRYLLYVVHDNLLNKPCALLISRDKKIYKFKECHLTGSALGIGTVLDGELVYNLTYKNYIFLVFDVLLYQHISYVDKIFSIRLLLIQKEILAKYGDYIENYQKQTRNAYHGIGLVRKAFVKKADLSLLLSKIKYENNKRVFYDTDRRHHYTDGIIFQPNNIYIPNRNYELMKWKWSDLRSIDMQIQIIPNNNNNNNNLNNNNIPSIHLFCVGPEDTLINVSKRGDDNVSIGYYDTLRLLADMEDLNVMNYKKNNIIIEVMYDTTVGIWSYLHIRNDKDKPNYIDTVMGVFMEQAESINIQELEYHILAAEYHIENEYEKKMNNAMNNILNEMKNNIQEMKKK